jgi:hypothetical protein
VDGEAARRGGGTGLCRTGGEDLTQRGDRGSTQDGAS